MALRAERQHRAWEEQWPWHVDGPVLIVALWLRVLLNFVPVVFTVKTGSTQYLKRLPGTCIRAPVQVLSPSHPRSSRGPDLGSSSVESEIDDTLSLPEPCREPAHPPVSLGCKAFSGTARVYHVLAHMYHKNTSARISLSYDV